MNEMYNIMCRKFSGTEECDGECYLFLEGNLRRCELKFRKSSTHFVSFEKLERSYWGEVDTSLKVSTVFVCDFETILMFIFMFSYYNKKTTQA